MPSLLEVTREEDLHVTLSRENLRGGCVRDIGRDLYYYYYYLWPVPSTRASHHHRRQEECYEALSCHVEKMPATTMIPRFSKQARSTPGYCILSPCNGTDDCWHIFNVGVTACLIMLYEDSAEQMA